MLIPEQDSRARLRRRTWRRVGEFARGVCLPTAALLFAVATRFNPVWPIEEYHDLASLFLDGRSLIYFAPLFAYSLFSVAHAILVPDFAGPHRLIRFGVYSGVILTAPIAAFAGISLYWTMPTNPSFVWQDLVLLLNFGLLVWSFSGRMRWPAWPIVISLLAFLLVFEFAVIVLTPPPRDSSTSLAVVLIVQAIGIYSAAPWVGLVTLIRQSARLARRYGEPGQFSLLDLLGAVSWCACCMAALRLAYSYVTRA